MFSGFRSIPGKQTMCDTVLALPNSSAAGTVLFGKNSDRQRNEAQVVEFHPPAYHSAGTDLRCTYIGIAQVARTNAVLLCRPFWMWGAEMGVNEHGVVIGNEALHARTPAQEQPALLGDDLVRLALERAASAAEAVELITTLLERHGQGGNNGHIKSSYFNNGFMIADAREAFVLETIGREWLLERVTDVRAMSNRYSIAGNVERRSDGLSMYLQSIGCKDGEPDDYSEIIANPHREHLGFAGARRACSTALLKRRQGSLSVKDVMAILRDHGTGAAPHPDWPEDAYVRRSVCMHAGGVDVNAQTTGTMVSELWADGGIHWVTGTSAPCTSIFKPVFLDAMPERRDLRPTDRCDVETLWWRHEQIHRAAITSDFARFLCAIAPQRDALEAEFVTRAAAVRGGTREDRMKVVAQCWAEADAMEQSWLAQIGKWATAKPSPQREGWAQMNALAGMPSGASA